MDQAASEEYGISSILLMEHAAMAVCSYFQEHIEKDKHILILCGPGNNGGDGFALARLLIQDMYEQVQLYCCVKEAKMSEDECQFAMIAKRYGIPIYTSVDVDEISTLLQAQDVLVDALFGTGLTRNIEGFYERLILQVNLAQKKVISIDIASGIHADTGKVMNCAIRADTTITFVCLKRGQVLYPGSSYSGEIIVKDISMPARLQANIPEHVTVLDHPLITSFLPKRNTHGNKGSFGKLLMVGGSSQMHGAITLAARSALVSGTGTLTLCIPDSIHAIVAAKLEESMLLPAASENGYFGPAAVALLKDHLTSFDVITIGNGMGRSKVSEAMVEVVLRSGLPCIIDGDALYELGKHRELLTRDALTILTPHPKEMSYLTGKCVEEILCNPMQVARDFVKEYPQVILVLKDQHTLINDQEQMYMNLAGNDALAKGGSGDVLCGMLSGLFAQSREGLKSACSAVYVHALCAEKLIEEQDVYSILPHDIISSLSNVYRSLKK